MPFLFLSPSTQYFNPYITTGDERYWMNALADEMTPYLHACGITVTRNDPDGSAAQSIRDSNASRQDFHLALHSNAAPQALSGRLRGVDIYYYPTSEAGLRMANILVDNIKPIYPLPDRVQARSSTIIGELRRTRGSGGSDRAGIPRQHRGRELADGQSGRDCAGAGPRRDGVFRRSVPDAGQRI